MTQSQNLRAITMKLQNAIRGEPTQQCAESNLEEVCVIALNLWEKAGRPAGRHPEFWLDAEQRVAERIARSGALKACTTSARARSI